MGIEGMKAIAGAVSRQIKGANYEAEAMRLCWMDDYDASSGCRYGDDPAKTRSRARSIYLHLLSQLSKNDRAVELSKLRLCWMDDYDASSGCRYGDDPAKTRAFARYVYNGLLSGKYEKTNDNTAMRRLNKAQQANVTKMVENIVAKQKEDLTQTLSAIVFVSNVLSDYAKTALARFGIKTAK